MQLWKLFILALCLPTSVLAGIGSTRNMQEVNNTNVNVINMCFCNSCDRTAQLTMAGSFSCAARIAWLQTERGLSEVDACKRVARDEHPNECGKCDPSTCQVQPICGIPTCTIDVLSTMACNDTLGGCHTCADRIRYTVTSKNLSSLAACEKVSFEQFPEECGLCSQTVTTRTLIVPTARPMNAPTRRPVNAPTNRPKNKPTNRPKNKPTNRPINAPSTSPIKVPSASPINPPSASPINPPSASPIYPPSTSPINVPSASPMYAPSTTPFSRFVSLTQPPTVGQSTLSPVTPDNVCRTATCTREVLDTMACNDNLGGCFTCGSRINYLINSLNYAPSAACGKVGYEQFMIACGGCMPDELRSPVPPVNSSKLIWWDEFDYEGAPDPSKWTYDIGTGNWGWGNNELQYYTDRSDNAYVSGGTLKIRALKQSYEGAAYSSARLKTMNRGDWKYGRIQIRTRLSSATARGTWSALWMLPTGNVYGGWPDSGEIDIMEHVGYDAGKFHGTVHSAAYNHMLGTQSGGQILAGLADWHIYEIDWSENKIDFILDGAKFHSFQRSSSATFREWPFDQNFHLIFNIAVGGSWGALQGINDTAFEGAGQVMEVDWVRVYSQ